MKNITQTKSIHDTINVLTNMGRSFYFFIFRKGKKVKWIILIFPFKKEWHMKLITKWNRRLNEGFQRMCYVTESHTLYKYVSF